MNPTLKERFLKILCCCFCKREFDDTPSSTPTPSMESSDLEPAIILYNESDEDEGVVLCTYLPDVCIRLCE